MRCGSADLGRHPGAWSAMTPPTSAASRPPPASRKPTSRFYRTFAQPLVRALVSSPMAEWMHRLPSAAAAIRALLRCQPDDGFRSLPWPGRFEKAASPSTPAIRSSPARRTSPVRSSRALDAWRDASEAWSEQTFLAVYGMPALQAACRRRPRWRHSLRKCARRARCIASCCRGSDRRAQVAHSRRGGTQCSRDPRLLYVGKARASVDERGFERGLRRFAEAHGDMPLSVFKTLVREQFNMLLIDQNEALAAIPAMLPPRCRNPARGVRARSAGARRARGILRRRQSD